MLRCGAWHWVSTQEIFVIIFLTCLEGLSGEQDICARDISDGHILFFPFEVDYLKVSTEFVTILHLFYVLVFWPQGIWAPSSPTRDGIHTPCFGR